MPNWCLNSVDIIGPSTNMARFEADITDNNGDVKDLFETISPIGEWDYDVAVEKWGTKWDVQAFIPFSPNYDSDYTRMRMTFDTAWSPPVQAFQRGSRAYTDLKFGMTWYEPGMCFFGGVIIQDGILSNEFDNDLPSFYPDNADHSDPDVMDAYHEAEWQFWEDWKNSRFILLNA
jgi:hypothetical protein